MSKKPGSASISCRQYRVTGRVQGVFFRDSTRQIARRLNLTGYARNKPDGSVEVLACGTPDALNEFGAWLRTGPPMAAVKDVESIVVDAAGPESFTIA